MKRFVSAAAALLFLCLPAAGQPARSTFDYQGRLTASGANYTGSADFVFTLYNLAAGGRVVAGPLSVPGVAVSGGVFAVPLDFGVVEPQGRRYLEIQVRTEPGGYTTLGARQAVDVVPRAASAIRAESAEPMAVAYNASPMTLDQSQVLPATGALASSSWQSLTAGITGSLTHIAVYRIGTVSNPNATLRIFSGAGTGGTVLHTQRVSMPAVTGEVVVGLSRLVPVTAGQMYTWEIATGGGIVLGGSSGNPYAGGQSGVDPDFDYYFKTYLGESGDVMLRSHFFGVNEGLPAAPLHVSGGSASEPYPQLKIGADATAPYGAFVSLDATKTAGGRDWMLFSTGGLAGEGVGKLVFKNQSDLITPMAIDSAGLVGIGTMNPGFGLDVQRAGNGNVLRLSSSATDASVLALVNTTAGGKNFSLLSTGNAVAAGNFVIRDVGSAQDRLTIYANGRTGMGSTTAPGGLLDVTGNGNGTVAIIGRAGPGPSAIGIYGTASGPGPKAAQFDGPVTINGNLTVNGSVSKTTGSFRIPHPLDPQHKWLFHSFVESPDMMNVYNGLIVLDLKGEALVELPDYFQALNSDYRYQLTAVGAPMPGLYISKEIQSNRFEIAGGKAGAKVSWQVTGIRRDAEAKESRIVPERERAATDP